MDEPAVTEISNSNYTMTAKNIIAVTVTYGKRWHLLSKVIEAALAEGLSQVIVVNNGSLEDIKSLSNNTFGNKIEVITLLHNTGSAGGFNVGLKRVKDLEPDYVLLLDDDNLLQKGCINSLLKQHEIESKSLNINNLAILAFRPIRLVDVSLGVAAKKINPRLASYFGFHVLDIPFKLWRRMPFVKKQMAKSEPTTNVYLNVASWSGLFFHTDLIEKHGYPDTNMVLYADDTEYTLRITESGGRIALCTSALIEDIDESWNLKSMFGNTFDGLLLGKSDFRAYYSTRNQAYLEYHRKGQVFLWSSINRIIHKFILAIRALMLNKFDRFYLLMQAMSDGKHKRLGVNNKFPLQ